MIMFQVGVCQGIAKESHHLCIRRWDNLGGLVFQRGTNDENPEADRMNEQHNSFSLPFALKQRFPAFSLISPWSNHQASLHPRVFNSPYSAHSLALLRLRLAIFVPVVSLRTRFEFQDLPIY